MSGSMQTQASIALDASRPQPALRGHGSPEQIRKSAKQFEEMFIGQMLQPMFQGLETDGMFGGGEGEQMFRSMLVDEYGKIVARSGGIGVADAVMRTMLEAQGEHRQ
ncbi:MAG: rod-binding protein [Alphaproteobacteria bacterium]|nr:rod-binding protein [Alphaproteobacteria bacterium]